MDTMDTEAAVREGLDRIKGHMPQTYKSIQDKADKVGRVAFALVRRSLKGEPNCFWAMERGNVVGTPFDDQEITRDIAQLMVQFGVTFVCIWGKPSLDAPAVGGTDGAN
jgi:hypothetical protein